MIVLCEERAARMIRVKMLKILGPGGQTHKPSQLHSYRKIIYRSVESDLCKRLTRSSALNGFEWNMCKSALVFELSLFVVRQRSVVLNVRFPKYFFPPIQLLVCLNFRFQSQLMNRL